MAISVQDLMKESNLFKPQKAMMSTKTMNYLIQASSPAMINWLNNHVILYDNTPPEEESDTPLWDQI